MEKKGLENNIGFFYGNLSQGKGDQYLLPTIVLTISPGSSSQIFISHTNSDSIDHISALASYITRYKRLDLIRILDDALVREVASIIKENL